MRRNSKPPEEVPPTLSKAEGRRRLAVMKEKGEQLLAKPPLPEPAFDTWANSTMAYIKETFGSFSPHINTFYGECRMEVRTYGSGPSESYREERRAESLRERIAVLQTLIEQLDTEISFESPAGAVAGTPDELLWGMLHLKVGATAKTRFDGGHYADAVEAALKELNTVVKEMVKKKIGKELDGADLMHQAFSPKAPIVVLADLSTESGRNEQQGYMEIFAGAMIGIRNPKAHQNLTITRERAVHFLFLASLLFNKLDERP